MKVMGIAGWKNSGKTGLMERLVSHFTAKGLSVSTVKHTHHSVDLDQPGKDSYRHREAGAQETLVVSGSRWAILHELRDAPEPELPELLSKLAPVDLILVEGYKRGPHPRIEAHRQATGQPYLAADDTGIVAVAADAPELCDQSQPVFDLNDTQAIAAFIRDYLQIS
ncbi:molybdopterin-guanine dinucleotide biosynthesis protein B [Pseudooceanicola sp. MF1-13]|uniref:molybdopterin-guanine dinucleotide biosynthesis protein B n=1 Tax=Pseudooceanicola sp. MF1-13 TaxID=3379095 RepID=UPI003891837A